MNAALFRMGSFSRSLAPAIGSAFRRHLLGCVEGTAVTAVKIRGVPHEYAELPGVKEDVLEIIEKLGKVTIGGIVEKRVWLRLQKEGPGEVTVADFAPMEGLSFPDPSQYICALAAKEGGLRLDVEVGSGVGYRRAQDNKLTTHEPGTIALDSSFSPVTRAWFSLEGDGEAAMLVLGVETNGSVSPAGALTSAARELLRDLRRPFERKELSETEARLTSQWLPRGRATTLGNLIEARLLSGSADDALEDVDVSFNLEPGDFLDNPDEERLVLNVKVLQGPTPWSRIRQALNELHDLMENASKVAAASPGEAPEPLLGAARAKRSTRRFERVSPAVEMEDPLSIQRDSFDRFVAPEAANGGLAWLLRESLNVDAGEKGRLELIEWSLGEAPEHPTSAMKAGDTYALPLWATVRLTRPDADVVEQRLPILSQIGIS